MKQSKLASLIETIINTFIGFIVAYIAWPPIALFYGLPYSHSQHFGIVLFFTVISIIRGYIIRRFFNAQLHQVALSLTKKINKL